jgi:hypothetical protein
VENIEVRRQPMPDVEALYLLSPSEGAVQRLKQDFADPAHPMYAAAHVYFTSHLPNDLSYALRQVLPGAPPAPTPRPRTARAGR